MSDADADANALSAAAGLPVLAPGVILADRFRLESLAGQGGMSIVWRATDLALEHETALKFLPTVLASDRAALVDLRREARRARDLAHPNICRVYDYGEDLDQGLAWISMEFLQGGNVSRKLKDHPRGFLEPAEIIGWLRELCEALHYAHETEHVVHRDLKPANLMLDMRGHIHITDFGIARSISESFTRLTGAQFLGASTQTGTLYYMSPQQARGERPSPTDDFYSLGATIFELLTGVPPFTEGDLNWQREHAPPAHLNERRRQLHGSVTAIPDAWEVLVQRLLAKHQTHRPQSAREIMKELAALETSAAIASAPATVISPVPAPAPLTPAAPVAIPAPPPIAPKPAPPAATQPPPLPPAAANPLPAEANPEAVPAVPLRSNPWMWALAGLLLVAIVLGILLRWVA